MKNKKKYGIIIAIILIAIISVSIFYASQENNNVHKRAGIVLTFDDWYIKDWFDARKLFAKYGAKANFFIARFDTLTNEELDMLTTLKKEGHEIASHGLSHLHAVKFCEQHSIQEYIQTEIIPAINLMTEKGFPPKTFAYPYGAHNATIDSALLKYFNVVRVTEFGYISTPYYYYWKYYFSGTLPKYYYSFEENKRICAGIGIDSSYGHTEKEIIHGLQGALTFNCAIIFYGHRISQEAGKNRTNPNLLETIFKFVNANNMKYYCVNELWDLQERNAVIPRYYEYGTVPRAAKDQTLPLAAQAQKGRYR